MSVKKKTQIKSLKEKRAQLDKRIKKMEALEKQRERKRDTRRKILIGSYYLDQAIKNKSMQELKTIMSKYLSRESDRALFELLAE